MYCCGQCNNRYCCSSLPDRLDQKLCTPEDCDGYYGLNGYYYKPPSCYDYEEFCCGRCESRYCCSYPSSRLNQSTCPEGIATTKRTTTNSYSSPSTTIFFYVIGVVIGGVLILFIMCFVFIILHIKSKQRGLQTIPENNNNVIRSGYPGTQPVNYNVPQNNRSAFVVADNSAYNYDINKIYNPNINVDLPPSYDTINLKEKKPNETVETNL